MPNKRESSETLMRAIKFTGLEMVNKMVRFRDSGLSKRTIEALVYHGIDTPERVLFMTEVKLRTIHGASMRELKAYKARYISAAR